MSQAFPFRKVYGAALLLAAVSLYGLLSALLGDGVWDALSWLALSIPLGVIVWKYLRAKSESKRVSMSDSNRIDNG